MSRQAGWFRCIGFLCVTALVAALFFPARTACQETGASKPAASAQGSFEQIVALRLDGEYNRAIELLYELIATYERSDDILRRAYNHLVTVHVQNDDEAGAQEVARSALERFPDLTADELEFPGRVNEVYDLMRKQMFGSFVITQPKECHVYMDSTYVGDTPLSLPLVRVGEYDLKVTKSGYKDYAARIAIEPELTRDLSGLALERDRAWWWWPAWIGGAVVSVVAVAVGVSGGDDGTPAEPEPLPPPPTPPGD